MCDALPLHYRLRGRVPCVGGDEGGEGVLHRCRPPALADEQRAGAARGPRPSGTRRGLGGLGRTRLPPARADPPPRGHALMVLLDTDCLVGLIRGHPDALPKPPGPANRQETIATTALNVAEVFRGAHGARDAPRALARVRAVLTPLVVLPF